MLILQKLLFNKRKETKWMEMEKEKGKRKKEKVKRMKKNWTFNFPSHRVNHPVSFLCSKRGCFLPLYNAISSFILLLGSSCPGQRTMKSICWVKNT